MTYEELLKQNNNIVEENKNLIQEIRNLRCTMLEAANHINIIDDPILFKRLISDANSFVTHEKNPYPEHNDVISEQYLLFLSKTLK
jgi:hypothetical protein